MFKWPFADIFNISDDCEWWIIDKLKSIKILIWKFKVELVLLNPSHLWNSWNCPPQQCYHHEDCKEWSHERRVAQSPQHFSSHLTMSCEIRQTPPAPPALPPPQSLNKTGWSESEVNTFLTINQLWYGDSFSSCDVQNHWSVTSVSLNSVSQSIRHWLRTDQLLLHIKPISSSHSSHSSHSSMFSVLSWGCTR